MKSEEIGEIIIDGVNVVECAYYNEENKPYCCEIWDNECEAQNCYYKQYLRLKQENKVIKKEYEKIQKVILADISFKEIVLSGITPSNILSQIKEQNKKYKQALEEIREIANYCEGIKDEATSQSEFTVRQMSLQDDKLINIIKKINEVLND